jgi:hypothetical protein
MSASDAVDGSCTGTEVREADSRGHTSSIVGRLLSGSPL